MANRKPPHARAEIEALAERWRSEWTPNDGIDPWLRRHLSEMTTMIRDERWSWNDLAQTLNEAGILYATGRHWSAARLGAEAARLRMQARRRIAAPPVPHDLARTIREALAATAGAPANITINLPSPVAQPAQETSRQTHGGAAASRHTTLPPRLSSYDADDPAADPGFVFARPRGLSPVSAASAPGECPSNHPADASTESKRDVDSILREFVSRPRRGSIPMPSIPEPEEE